MSEDLPFLQQQQKVGRRVKPFAEKRIGTIGFLSDEILSNILEYLVNIYINIHI